MRIIFCPAVYCRGADMIKVVGTCRKCRQQNVVSITRGHVATLASIPCEHCGNRPVPKKKNNKTSEAGIEWQSSSCWKGKAVGQNLPETAKMNDLVM